MRYAVFICTHGRPNRQSTLQALREAGYLGMIFLVLDDEDDTAQGYVKYENDHTKILVFNKQEWIDRSETGIPEDIRSTVLYAKNFCEHMASDIFNLDAYILADDDLLKFYYPIADMEIKYCMQDVIYHIVEYLLTCNICMLGFMAKPKSKYMSILKYVVGEDRLPYHFMVRNCRHRVNWRSFIGQDLIGNLDASIRGRYIFNIHLVQYTFTPNTSISGGMKSTYELVSDYTRTICIFKYYPSSVEMSECGDCGFEIAYRRNNMCPMLVSSRYKKG